MKGDKDKHIAAAKGGVFIGGLIASVFWLIVLLIVTW